MIPSETTTQLHLQIPSPSEFKVAQLDLFHGDRKKIRQSLNQVDLNLLLYSRSLKTEEQKIIYTSTHPGSFAANAKRWLTIDCEYRATVASNLGLSIMNLESHTERS